MLKFSDFPKGKTLVSFAQNLGKSGILMEFWANQKWKKKSFLKNSFWSKRQILSKNFLSSEKPLNKKKRKKSFLKIESIRISIEELPFIMNHIEKNMRSNSLGNFLG